MNWFRRKPEPVLKLKKQFCPSLREVCPDNYRETEGEKGNNLKLPKEISEKTGNIKSYYDFKS